MMFYTCECERDAEWRGNNAPPPHRGSLRGNVARVNKDAARLRTPRANGPAEWAEASRTQPALLAALCSRTGGADEP